jgi:hypothetical protein
MQALKALMFNRGTPEQVARRTTRRETYVRQLQRFFGEELPLPPNGGPGTRDARDQRPDAGHLSAQPHAQQYEHLAAVLAAR